MKTLNNTYTAPATINTNGNGNGILMRALLLSVLTLFVIGKVKSQNNVTSSNKNFGLALYSNININGYGAEYLPGIYYKSKRKQFFVAPTIQYQKGRLSGTNFMFQYLLVGPGTSKDKEDNCKLELYTFISVAFHYNAVMGKNTGKYERVENPDYFKKDIADYKYKSIEAFGGIGLGIPFLKHFKWVNSIGLGAFTTFNPNKETHYYNNHACGLMFRTGITFDIK